MVSILRRRGYRALGSIRLNSYIKKVKKLSSALT